MLFVRPESMLLRRRLREPVRLMTIITGPRQIGKTTLIETILRDFQHAWYMAVDSTDDRRDFAEPTAETTAVSPSKRDSEWLKKQWQHARKLARNARHDLSTGQPFVFAIDEVQ